MNCNRCSSHFSDLVDGVLDRPTEIAVRTHLGSCADCQRDWDNFKRSLSVLHDALRHSPDAFAPAGLEERIATSLSNSSAVASSGAPTPLRAIDRRFPNALRRIATVAAVLLALAIGFLAGHEEWLSTSVTIGYRSESRDAERLQPGSLETAMLATHIERVR